MTDLIKEVARGFVKTQKAELIDKITNGIAGLFDPNAKLDERLEGKDNKVIKTLQYPLDIDSDNYQHKIIFKAKSFKSISFNEKGRPIGTGSLSSSNSIKGDSKIATTHSIIQMYQPNDITSSYSNNWASEELGVAGGAQKDTSFLDFTKIVATKGVISAAKSLLGGIGVKARAAEKFLGTAVNPRLAMLFNGVEHRQFSFNFRFAPKSEQEVLHCIAIIKSFKYFAAPGLSEKGSFFNYPELFEIKMINGSDENKSINKFGISALTNIEVNYSPQSVWQTFENGFPVVVDMTLQFREIDIITKKNVLEGM